MIRDDGSAATPGQSRHPDKSILLAYIRRQPLDDRLSIQQHIEHCEQCSQQCDEYKRISSALEDALTQVRRLYPRLSSHVYYSAEKHLYESGKSRAAQRFRDDRPKRRMARPRVAISLVLLVAILLTAVAYAVGTNHTPLIYSISHQGIATTQPSPDLRNLEPPPQVTTKHKHPPKHRVAPAATPSVSPPTTPTSMPKPSMAICDKSVRGTAMFLKVCGEHFTPGDEVIVILEYPEYSKSLAPVTVDAKGGFEEGFMIACWNVPIVIHASDQSHKTEAATLIDFPRDCTPAPGDF